MSEPAGRRGRRSLLLGVVAAALLAAGVIAIVVAVRAQRSAPQPPRSAARQIQVHPREPSSSMSSSSSRHRRPHASRSSGAAQGPILPRSRPVQLSVPAIGVHTTLRTIGLSSTGEIQTPPLARDSHAYWLRVSPTPGQLGPATIIGHVDSAAYGPAIFFKLGALRQRDMISVRRADGSVARFEVERVVEYPKSHFPTHAVYGNTDDAALRLITCGGTFNSATHNYESNIVVYAAMVSVRHRA